MLNFEADYEPIAKGIFAMLVDMSNKGDESYLTALAFGMLPAPLMDMAENQFIEKIAEPSIKLGFGKDAVIRTIKKTERDTINKFMKGLSVAILKVAKENNNLVV